MTSPVTWGCRIASQRVSQVGRISESLILFTASSYSCEQPTMLIGSLDAMTPSSNGVPAEDEPEENVEPWLMTREDELTCGMCAGVFIGVNQRIRLLSLAYQTIACGFRRVWACLLW